MWGYILGIVCGSIVLALLGFMLLVYLTRSLTHQRHIKMLGLKAEVKINNDIKIWARQTGNLFLSSNHFIYKGKKRFAIDAILITPQALFVIEVKAMRGIIDGDAELSYWTKKIGNKELKIANPIFENEKHIDEVMQLLNVQVPTVSLVIFSNRADYITVKNRPDHVLVFKHNQLFENLDALEKNLSVSLSKYEMRVLYGKLKGFQMSKWAHFKNEFKSWRGKTAAR